MNLIKLFLVLFLSIVVSTLTHAGFYDDWPDESICSWLKQKPTHEGYLSEASKRGLKCSSKQASTTSSSNTSLSRNILVKKSIIIVYDVDLSDYDFGEVKTKSDFDVSEIDIANNASDINCTFAFKRVVNDTGRIQGPLATGRLSIVQGKINFLNHYWRTGGLANPSFLKNEANLYLTKDGHIEGKMPFFHLWVDSGEPPYQPIYSTLKKHKKSKPLSYKKQKQKAEFWFEVDSWAGGIMYLFSCSPASPDNNKQVKSTIAITTSEKDPTVTKIIKVIQGDKLIVDIAEPHKLAGSDIQLFLRDIDAPDVIKSCPKQIELGVKVKDIVTQKLADATSIKLKNYKKTARGVIAQVIVDGKDLGKELLAKGYASDEYGYWKGYFCNAMWAVNNGNVLNRSGEIDRAIFWYERALTLDENMTHKTIVSYELSELYNLLGNDAKSLEWLTKAANYGVMEAQENLAVRYIEANGVVQDLSEAKYWLKKALLQGSEKAEMLLEEIQ